jgi:hypothetical protein
LSLIAYTNGTVSNEFEAEAVAVDPMSDADARIKEDALPRRSANSYGKIYVFGGRVNPWSSPTISKPEFG